MVVRGRHLVKQACERLVREDVHHGVLMAGHWLYRPDAPLQLCSIDTLRARKIYPDADLIVIDECHMATSDSYKTFLEAYPAAFILGVSATPYTEKSLSHVADVVVKPISILELIEQGYLVPPRYFAPSTPNLDDVKISQMTHDYVNKDLTRVMDTSTLIGDIVGHWKRLGEGRQTICFATSVEHSKHIADKFCSEGVKAEHMDADTPEKMRDEILKRFEKGETNVVVNCGILCTGVDLPFCSCIIMARPTKSYSLFIQQAGRGTRPFSGKKDFIILDHAGNILRHGFITEEQDATIDPSQPRSRNVGLKPRICGNCFAVYSGPICSGCGFTESVHQTGKREIEGVDGVLSELNFLTEDQKIKIWINQKKTEAKRRGYKRGWVYYEMIKFWGQENADIYLPRRKMPYWG